jgi:hypothetical protein
MVAEEAPMPLSKRGMSGATKLIPKASRKTVKSIGIRPLSSDIFNLLEEMNQIFSPCSLLQGGSLSKRVTL